MASKTTWLLSCSGLSDRREQQCQACSMLSRNHTPAMRPILTNVGSTGRVMSR